jgi:hypothetical protein
MSDESDSPKPLRARRQGQTMETEERKMVQAVFLEAFKTHANLSAACDAALIHIDTPYDWKKRYKDFAKEFEDAEQRSNDSIDMEIYRRAVTGWEEPLVSAGKHVCNVKKYSDAMLTLLAKSRMKKYRDKQELELTGKDGGAIVVQRNPNLRHLNDEELDTLEAMARKATGGESDENT